VACFWCRVSPRWAPFSTRWALSILDVAGGAGSGGCGEREQALEDRLDVGTPGPVGWEVQPASSSASGEGGRGVEDLELQGAGFGPGEVA
jgi:hypothetical protein